ncbi:metallophosphoesterase [Sporosarcina sp. P33]|uniref:metallophosphoesterase n=1 Tax=Sporosarcina sp. P33 TaxID=1930764 RepID=UPI0009BF8362|nr:metallophosphoesterase [Sporosarcina sp. P33]ARD49569.1 phosphoesterase [Sporosarcina sp. P33]
MKKRLLYSVLGIITISYFFWFQNNSLTMSKTEIRSANLPASFDQFKIIHLTDLHNKSFGKNQQRIVRKVTMFDPDIIVYTGDLIDSNRTGDEAGLLLMKELTKVAPVYYVTGNHEWWSGTFNSLERSLNTIGVHVLRNEQSALAMGDDNIHIAGIDDPAHGVNGVSEREIAMEDIKTLAEEMTTDTFTILLAHRPELLPLYAESDFDLVFSGHAHGGQIRIPFVGGLIAPNQGVLPVYTAGEYVLNHTVMMVGRGLGNSIIPLRVFNRPEIVAVTLEAADE